MKLRFKIILSILLTALIFSTLFLIFIPLEFIILYVEDNILSVSISIFSTFALTTIIVFLLIKNISSPISKIQLFLQNLNLGKKNTENSITFNKTDEIGIISNELTNLSNTLREASAYAEKLKTGKTEAIESTIESDPIIGKALTEIRENFLSAEKEKKYSIEETKRTQWFQNGIADFSKLLQQDFKNTEDLSSESISKLVKHLEVEQAGIFILHHKNEKEILVLEATYAFDKKKKLDAEIEIGEGLVGKCAKEQKVLKIDNLPEGYTFIGSGLGEDTPESLLLVPMLYENNLFGVIEIASLYKISEYKIDLIVSIGERIAAEISNIKAGLITKTFAEDFQKQTEELAKKEKEAAETIVELKIAKDKIAEQEAETNGLMKALVSVASVVQYDIEGHITNINQRNLDIFNLNKEIQITKQNFEILSEADKNPEWFKEFWNDLIEGKIRTRENYIKFGNSEMWLFETFTPILDSNSKPKKIISIGIDITEQKLLETKVITGSR